MLDPKTGPESNQDHTAGEELEKIEGALADEDVEKVSGGGMMYGTLDPGNYS